MRQDNFWTVFNNLPPEAQKQVLDFMSFLAMRYKSKSAPKRRRVRLKKEPFVGIWSHRADMKDSAVWVRETRQRDWGE